MHRRTAVDALGVFTLLAACDSVAARAPAAPDAPLILECRAPEGWLRLFSASPLTTAPGELISGTYQLVRDGQTRTGSFVGTHHNPYGVALRVKLEQERVSLTVDESPTGGRARFWNDANGWAAPGFDACTGKVLEWLK
jgi:hypothetical protein